MKKVSTQPIPETGEDAGIREGMIVIPDISGFTQFVQHTDVTTGRQITFELLSSIIESNTIGLQVSEIEGDAILFYKYGPPPSQQAILRLYERMLEAFHEKLEYINNVYGQRIDVSLKLVAHYGALAEYQLGGFKKLYGRTVVEAHRLLKNSIDSRQYALLTNELIAVAGMSGVLPAGLQARKLCEVYGDLRHICFTWFDYEHIDALLPLYANK